MADDPPIQQEPSDFVRKLMPDATEAELREAQQAVLDYVAAVLRIHERIFRERASVDSEESQIS